MWPFDADKTKYPKTWADHSLEYKFMFAFFLCMMVMTILEREISAPFELLVAVALLFTFTLLSIRRRRALDWRWPGIHAKELMAAGFSVLLSIYFLYFVFPAFPFSPISLPLELAAVAMGSFFVLQQLKLVYFSEADFLESGGGAAGLNASSGSGAEVAEATWKKVVRGVYTITFLLWWLVAVAAPRFLFSYSPPMMIAAPMILLASGFVIHFVLGIRLLPNYPTLQEMREKRSSKGLP